MKFLSIRWKDALKMYSVQAMLVAGLIGIGVSAYEMYTTGKLPLQIAGMAVINLLGLFGRFICQPGLPVDE